MKGDFSRHTFDPADHFSGVRMQQGRVQLDADWNEQVDLALHRVETETVDTVGHCGGPLHDAGFRIIPLLDAPQAIKDAVADAYPGVDPDTRDDLVILPGRYYVDGALAVCEQVALFGLQPDRPLPLPDPALDPAHGLGPGTYLLYLDVWERHVTALEDPSLRERALGGPDTATRTRVVWQVGAFEIQINEGDPDCPEPQEWLDAIAAPDGRLRARARPAGPDQGPCVVPAGAGYRGLENQLYRVEVHGRTPVTPPAAVTRTVTAWDPDAPQVVTVVAGGGWQVGDTVVLAPTSSAGDLQPTVAQVVEVNGNDLTLSAEFELSVADDQPQLTRVTGATWKWSRDNGIAVSRVTGFSGTDGLRVVVDSLGQDEVLGFAKGDWVELTDDFTELNGLPGWLAVVDKLDPAAREVVLRTAFPGLDPATMLDFANRTTKLRRWDGLGVVAPGPLPGNYHELEDGVEVAFANTDFRTGDYWLIPARTATADEQGGNVEWPQEAVDQGVALPPLGIRHRYCRLGVATVMEGETPAVTDCRCLFPPLTEVRALAYVGGAGQEGMPLWGEADPRPELGLPLVVGVGNGHCRVDGRVRFTVEQGDGDVTDTMGVYPGAGQKEVIVPIGPGGMAACWWRLGLAPMGDDQQNHQHQVVMATLQERVIPPPEGASPEVWIDVSGPVLFNASLSVADQVAYLPDQDCTPMAEQFTVQDAIDHLIDLVSLYPLGGDGQEARPGQPLPCPLRLRAASACGTRGDVDVEFTVLGGGSLSGVVGGQATTDGNGEISVGWTLGQSGCQQVVARLLTPEADSAEPRTVVFTATLSVAAEVEYTPADACGMANADPAVETVQDALDWLCARVGGGCHGLTVSPEPGWMDRVRDFIELHDEVDICFRAGEYEVTQTLEVLGRTTVVFHGAGPATRFRAGQSPRVFHFQGCGTVVLQHFFAESQVVAGGEPNGVLSMLDCRRVTVEDVGMRCPAGRRRDAACLMVMNQHAPGSPLPESVVEVRRCEAEVGDRQIGILLVNPGRAVVEDNQVSDWGVPLQISGESWVPSVYFVYMIAAAVALTGGMPNRFNSLIFALFGIDGEDRDARRTWLGPWWRRFHEQRTAPVGPPALRQMMQRFIVGQRTDADEALMMMWMRRLENAAAQGIVVAGSAAGDVLVRGNTVQGAVQGIHVGLSHGGAPRRPDVLDRVVITGNSVMTHLPVTRGGLAHGIFLGNCHSALIEENRLASSDVLQHFREEQGMGDILERRQTDGIRAYGYFGPMLVIRENHSEDFTTGIYVSILNAPDPQPGLPPTQLWRVAHNVAVHSWTGVFVDGGAGVVQLDGNVDVP
jgi:Family of unknown function (DUF6519)